MSHRTARVVERRSRGWFEDLAFCCLFGLILTVSCDNDDDSGTSPAQGVEIFDLGDGLQLQILSTTISGDRKVVVDFELADSEGTPADLSQLDGNPSFVIAWIAVDPENNYTHYQSYVLREVEGAEFVLDGETLLPALESAEQAAADSGGFFETFEPGLHRYTFGTRLPAGYDRTATHSVGVYATREGRSFVANDVFTFVPAGGAPVVTRDVVRTEDCNACHGELALHGGARRKVELCVLCHTDQTVDPESGENLDMGRMIHKIHHGQDLSNDFFIVGFRQSVHDYSTLAYPQDDRNCSTCHREPEPDETQGERAAAVAASDASNWRRMPSRAHCGACHDHVNFETGEGHSGGLPVPDDTLCARCHRDIQIDEFDRTVPGAHVVPYESSFNPQLAFEITDVQNMTPGNPPSVRFTARDKNGPVDITTLNRVSAVFVGPTSDYIGPRSSVTISDAAGTLMENAPGDYTFTPGAYSIPMDADGTWTVGLEGRTETIQAGPEGLRFGSNNPVAHVDVAAGELGVGSPEPRRDVVNLDNCNVCHQRLRFHGNLRSEIQYCVLCHNPWFTASDEMTTVDFKVLVHKIHRGEDLTKPYRDFNEVRYPRFVGDCEACHRSGTQLLPLPEGVRATVINIDRVPVDALDAVRPPVTSSCTACHDTDAAITHAALNSIIFDPLTTFEACDVCHGEGRTAAVSEAHAR